MLYKERPTLGLVSEHLPVDYYYPVFKGIYNICTKEKVNLRIFLGSHIDSTHDYIRIKNIIYQYAGKQNVDGIITTSSSMSYYVTEERFNEFISGFNVPKVSIGLKLKGIPSIIVDNKKSLYNTVCHLIETHGLKKIAFIKGPDKNEEAQERFAGYKEALADHGILFDPQLCVKGRFLIDCGIKGCKTLFEERNLRPQAIVCANDNSAMGVFLYCRKNGIRIPRDLAVTGFDNIANSRNLSPQLTTVAQTLYAQGAEAAKSLINIIKGKPVKKCTVLPTPLLIRRSCGCPTFDKIVKDPGEAGGTIGAEQKEQIHTALAERFNKFMEAPIAPHPEKLVSIMEMVIEMMASSGNDDNLVEEIKERLLDPEITEFEINKWFDCILIFYRDFVKLISQPEQLARIEYVFFVLQHLLQRIQGTKMGNKSIRQVIDNHQHSSTLNNIACSITLSDLFHSLKNMLVSRGYSYFYLSLYDGGQLGYLAEDLKNKKMRLFIGYDGKDILDGNKKEILFDPKQLIPDTFFSGTKEHIFLAYPLAMNEYHFGTFIIEFKEAWLTTYKTLIDQLNNTLNLIRLFENARQKQSELNEININLEHKVSERTSELTRANEKLHALDKMKTTFFSNISHELRTPLTLLLGPLESFHAGEYGPSLQSDAPLVSAMIGNGSRLLKLINTLLDFSKLDAGKLEPVKKMSSISGILKYYMSIVKNSGDAKGIKTSFENRGGRIFASIDRELFEKAFYNLISNALKFTPSGGTIRVVLKKDENTEGQTEGKKTFSIEVHDTGCGIKKDKLETIFERFTMLDENEMRSHEGTGIGLAYTREIVSLHDGTIYAASSHGKGTVFTMTLPLAGEPEGQEGPGMDEDEIETVKKYLLHDLSVYAKRLDKPRDKRSNKGQKSGTVKERGRGHVTGDVKRVCIVDDNPDVRDYLTSILEKHYNVITCENGQIGLETIKEQIPDLVVSDVMMPVMNGLELCKKIKENPGTCHIPVLLLTARMDLSGKLEGLANRADDYLFKPFNARELLSRLENLLVNRELQHELAMKQNLLMTSIKYAGRIQSALLPPPSVLDQHLADHFEFWKPRDIVSGDLYWFKESDDSFLIALADCTGHGIPGALMTMITHSLLNRITEHMCRDNPARILSELNRLIKIALNQEKESKPLDDPLSDDGLDIGLCYFDKKKKMCTYAGARRPLYYIENGELKQKTGDRQSIGYRRIPTNAIFTNHTLGLKGKSCFYLTTDGYADQLKGRGIFGTGRLKKMLLRIAGLPMEKQKKELSDTIDNFIKNEEQTDDITIVGFCL